MGISRTELRRLVGDRRGDLLLLTATEDAEDNVSLTDKVRLGDRGDNAPTINGRILYFAGTESTPAHTARVTSFATSSRTITFLPAAPSPVVEGQEVELYLLADHLGSIDTIHRLLNAGIRAVERHAEAEVVADPQTWNMRGGTLTVPESWVEFGGADWNDLDGTSNVLPVTRLRVNPATRTVTITGAPASRANGRSVTLWGYPVAEQLTSDTQETNVDAEWLVEGVLSQLAVGGSWKSGDSPREERRGNFWATQALTYRRSIAAPRRGLRIALR